MNATASRHAATPWTAHHTAGHETHGQTAIYAEDGDGRDIAIVYDGAANAAFIVQAVNAHDELVAACEITLANLEAIGTHPDTLPMIRLRAALAKAKGVK